MAGSVAEFDYEGRTYKIQVDHENEFSPYYFVNQVRPSVGAYDDLNSGQRILVSWENVGVIRVLEGG